MNERISSSVSKTYAHSLPGRPQSEWQALEAHLKSVATLARQFAEPFDSVDWAWNAGWLHDVGKATNAFQSYLARSNGLDDSNYDSDGSQSNHASSGAALAEEKLGLQIGRVLAYLSAGHHAGLPDWHALETGNAALSIQLNEGRNNLKHIKDFAATIISKLAPVKRPPSFVMKSEHYHLWVRMLFSCLVDADYLDTEHFMEPGKAAGRGSYPELAELAQKFFPALDQLERDARKTSVNAIRSEIRQSCERAAELPQGFFSLTVPTGGGKTLSAMAFALRHALKHGHKRVIYVIPYTSIIEQTAHALKNIFGAENVVEHHSNLDPQRKSPRLQLASENWDAPIIVTTNVQFFESLYAAKSSRCRKLHNVVNSVVILDEAQLLPPELLAPCVDAMNQLVRNYGVTLVLATATQPALFSLPKPCPCLEKATEIIPPEMNLYDRLKRVEYSLPSDFSKTCEWSEIAARLQQHEQVLCVVNTRRDCHDLFRLMPDGTIHLSALMCGEHRSKVIAQIKRRLKDGLPIRVISTQLVEAGVDIDFPVVYRALAGLDSIAQAAGRCNREGKLNKNGQVGKVHVFVPPKPAPRGLLLKGENKTRELCVLPEFDPHCPDTYSRYFQLFYAAVNDTGADWLRDRLVKDVNPDLFFQFRTAGQEFRLIRDEEQETIIVRYGKSDELLQRLRFAGPTREIMRGLQRNMVHLPVRMAERMKQDGLLEEIHAGIWAQSLPSLYDQEIGLNVFRESLSPEDLIQ
ncbi:MAG: CRISPR-associated helicase Cas3' [Lentisphaerae bacterium]|nr:CRISPR-associated helicase Cas3' [Lentisphaerota bacterium]